MGYSTALEKAGCKILDYAEFGDYQGSWFAFVEYNGERGVVAGSYGSCSGCDAFQAEFDYSDEPPEERNGKYYRDHWHDDREITKEEYDKGVADYNERLADFGRSYLVGGLYNKQHYEDLLAKLLKEDGDSQFSWDIDQREACKWAINQDWPV